MPTLGFVGLGSMGGRLARRLLKAGFTVAGYNRTRAKVDALIADGLRPAASPRACAEASEVVFSMVADTAALQAVGLGAEGIVAGLRPGATWVEMSTVSPGAIRALAAEVGARGAAMLDAPISGSIATLEQGQLSIMAGGDAAVLERVRPFLLTLGPTITHMGPVGSAATMKVATNLGLGVQMLAFSEAVALAEKAGIAREQAVEALLRSVIASPMVKYRGPFVLRMPEEVWFNVSMMQKDLELALELGRSAGVPLPSTALAHEMLTAARGCGLAEFDFAVMFDVLARMSGLPGSPKTTGGG